MGLSVFPVPLHKMVLNCQLVQGEVAVGVRTALPIEGIHLILWNGLAGSRVWTDTPPSPVVTLCPSDLVSEKNPSPLQEISSSCVVTHAMCKAETEVPPEGNDTDVVLEVPSFSKLPLSLSHSEMVQEQCNDVSLKEILDRVLPASEIRNVASGYFLHNSLLVRKWVPVSEDGVKNEVFQIVFPTKFRSLILKVAHDECGHFGVRKTYLNILKHLFWHFFSIY